jgi:hypothetical protein
MYIGEVFTQGDSQQEIISFCAPAEDIRKWGGVPTKTERFHGGFQRALTDRYKKIIEFFERQQISPTSVVVAFKDKKLNVDTLGYPSSWPPSSNINHHPNFAMISFEVEDYDLESEDIESLCIKVATMLKNRVEVDEDGEMLDENDSDESSEVDENEDVEVEDSEEDDADTASVGLDVGHSKLKKFYEFVIDYEKVKSWISDENNKYDLIKSKTNKTKKEKEQTEYTPEQRLRFLLVSLLKPGVIVDGQHRVEGASNASTDNPVVFNVCAIKDSDWVEQVFQFVVINKLAKPISGSFLTSILNTSLTNEEIKEIEPRLEQIGIKNTDRIIMNYINYDEKSPFYGMVSQPGEIMGVDNTGKLSDIGMLKLAKMWRAMTGNKSRFRMFTEVLDGSNAKKKTHQWVSENAWVKYFFAFWDMVKEKYEPEHLWVKEKKFHLLMIVTMTVLQEYFLETKAAAKIKFRNIDDFKCQIKEFYEDVPGSFFVDWKRSGLQSGDGPEIIQNAIKSLLDGVKLSKVKEESALFLEL